MLKKAEEQITQGADILDLGVCSTRPNSVSVGAEIEISRLGNSIQEIKKHFPDILISIDSYLPQTVNEALNQGADFVNDVSGLGDVNGLGVLAKEFSVPYILMDNPAPMHHPQSIDTNNSFQAIIKRLNIKLQTLRELGLKDVILDPGFGFGKTTDENYDILKHLESFMLLNTPIMVALSRKRMVCEEARDGKLTIEDLQGGTFTISNGGVYGSMLSTPILNLPQSGVLGMHNIVERPVVVEGEIKIRPIMYLALSYDHRIIDGKESVSFLKMVKENLEDPRRLFLDI